MRSVIVRVFILALIVAIVAGCSSSGTGGTSKVTITPEQAWNAGKAAAKGIGVGLILAESKDGKILGVPSSDAIAAVGPVVDTLAADFEPGAKADADARAKTRDVAATQFARAMFKADFSGSDDAALARQKTDVAAIRSIIDAIADSLLSTFAK